MHSNLDVLKRRQAEEGGACAAVVRDGLNFQAGKELVWRSDTNSLMCLGSPCGREVARSGLGARREGPLSASAAAQRRILIKYRRPDTDTETKARSLAREAARVAPHEVEECVSVRGRETARHQQQHRWNETRRDHSLYIVVQITLNLPTIRPACPLCHPRMIQISMLHRQKKT